MVHGLRATEWEPTAPVLADLMQAILDRFGSNIRAQEAHAKLLIVSQGKRSVWDYTSEFETLLRRLSTRDEDTWKKMYVWGLQPHLAKAVALK